MINTIKNYFDALNTRDRRAIILGGVSVGIILVYLFLALPLMEDWSQVRTELKMYRGQIESVSGQTAGAKAKIVGLSQTVPFMDSPVKEDQQRKLFWDKTYDQLKSAGIKLDSGPAYIGSTTTKQAGQQRTLRLKFAGSCKYEQWVKFLGQLNENPYLVSIEEFSVKANEKKPEMVTIEMTIGTFVK